MTLHPQPLPPCPTSSNTDHVAATVYYVVLFLVAPCGVLAFRRWRRAGGRTRTALFVAYVLCALLWVDSFALSLVYTLAPVCRL